MRTSPEPYFRIIRAFNWSKNNFGESHISLRLTRLGDALSILLFSLDVLSLSPYKDLNYLQCHHRAPVSKCTLREGPCYKIVWDCENISSPKGRRQLLRLFSRLLFMCLYYHDNDQADDNKGSNLLFKSSCKLMSQQGTSSLLVHRP